MPNAVINVSSFLGDGTQGFFLAQINAAMVVAGFTLLDSYTAGGGYRVWNFPTGGGFTYSTLCLEFGFSNATNSCGIRGYSNWSTSTKTGANPSAVATSGITSLSAAYTLYSINHPEVRGVFCFEGITPRFFIGYFRPDPSLPANSWYNENQSPLAYIVTSSNSTDFSVNNGVLQSISSLRALSGLTNVGFTQTTSTSGNTSTGNTRVLFPATITTNNNETIHVFSPDVALCGASGLTILDYFTVDDTKRYTFFNGSNASTAKLFVRSA
jgi:hypothetical protein